MARVVHPADFDLETEVRRQIRATRDLAAVVRDLGFDIDFAERARDRVAALEATIRAEVRDVAALKAALTAARSQLTGAGVRFDVADRALLDEVEAAGDDRAAVHAVLNRNPVSAQLPFVERIPVMRGGLVSWRTPVDNTIIRKRPSDKAAFERVLGELGTLFAAPQRSHREPLRQEVLDALERVRRDAQRVNGYMPTALQFLNRTVEAFLQRGASPSAAVRFEELLQLLRRFTLTERALAMGPPPEARGVAELASEYVATPGLHVPSLTHRAVAMLLAPPYISVSVWYRRRRFVRVLQLLRQEIAEGHYDRTEVARRLQQLEAGGAFFSSLVYPLLRVPGSAKAKPVAVPTRGQGSP